MLRSATLAACTIAACYLIASFMSWSLNPGEWSTHFRAFVAPFSVFVAIGVVSFYGTK